MVKSTGSIWMLGSVPAIMGRAVGPLVDLIRENQTVSKSFGQYLIWWLSHLYQIKGLRELVDHWVH